MALILKKCDMKRRGIVAVVVRIRIAKLVARQIETIGVILNIIACDEASHQSSISINNLRMLHTKTQSSMLSTKVKLSLPYDKHDNDKFLCRTHKLLKKLKKKTAGLWGAQAPTFANKTIRKHADDMIALAQACLALRKRVKKPGVGGGATPRNPPICKQNDPQNLRLLQIW